MFAAACSSLMDRCTSRKTICKGSIFCFSHFKNETDVLEDNITNLHQVTCEARGNSSHECFWNPQSRITGECCNTCHQVCLSKQTSLNFVQFCVGIFFISMATPLFYVVISAITSDITPAESQGKIIGIVLVSEVVARIFFPFIFVWSYESSSNHTYPYMTLSSIIFLALLVSLVVLYTPLAPRPTCASSEADLTVSHFNPLSLHEREYTLETEAVTGIAYEPENRSREAIRDTSPTLFISSV